MIWEYIKYEKGNFRLVFQNNVLKINEPKHLF